MEIINLVEEVRFRNVWRVHGINETLGFDLRPTRLAPPPPNLVERARNQSNERKNIPC